MEKLANKIEALLFYTGEPFKIKKLASFLNASEDEVSEAVNILEQSLEGRGVTLMKHDDEVSLATAPEFSEMILDLKKDELNKDLSKATLETLSIILYKNGATRNDIDYIRGVNSSFILRNLLIRGLIKKEVDAHDSRRYVYKPTLETLSYMGVKSIEELPEYATFSQELNKQVEGRVEEVAE